MATGVMNAVKREEIVTAFMDCVRELGLERASMGEVAARIGLDRSTLYYYFKAKQELVEEAARHLAQGYLRQLNDAIARFKSAERARQLVEHVFGTHFHQAAFSVIMDEFTAASNRDKAVEHSLAEIYRAYEAAIIREINGSYPNASQKLRRDVAYTISQLAEGVSVFLTLGFGADRRIAARNIALMLLDRLASGEVNSPSGKPG